MRLDITLQQFQHDFSWTLVRFLSTAMADKSSQKGKMTLPSAPVSLHIWSPTEVDRGVLTLGNSNVKESLKDEDNLMEANGSYHAVIPLALKHQAFINEDPSLK